VTSESSHLAGDEARKAPHVPLEQSTLLRYYSSRRAIDECSVYRLGPEEEYLISKYYHFGDRLLDLACGMGRTTLRLYEMGFSVVGIDLAEVLINAARKRFPYLDLRVGSFNCIEEPNAAFSHVLISSNAIDLAVPESNRTAVLRECARVLRPGGTLIYSCNNLKCLHLLSPRLWRRPFWKLRHTLKAFQSLAYVSSDGLQAIFAAPETAIRETEDAGFRFLEMRGRGMSAKPWFNRYFSHHIHYAFRKF